MQGLHCDPVSYWAQMHSLHKMESLLDNSLVKFQEAIYVFKQEQQQVVLSFFQAEIWPLTYIRLHLGNNFSFAIQDRDDRLELL